MVANVTSLTRSGLSDFVVQRVSAAVLALYSICVLGFFFVTPEVDYEAFTAYFNGTSMRMFSTLAVLAFAAHAWIGMWTIGTDYLREAHVGGSATAIRLAYQALCLGVIFVFVVWGLNILWSS
ncbi:MAG: succinate dehydrogenase, hydrophobic membrane anchor protein [Pseudomonadota bacterium]